MNGTSYSAGSQYLKVKDVRDHTVEFEALDHLAPKAFQVSRCSSPFPNLSQSEHPPLCNLTARLIECRVINPNN
jgi:hypothetical protein